MRNFKSNKNSNITFYTDCTQKECINFLSEKYGKTKKYFLDFIKNAKSNSFVWDCMEISNNEITFVFKDNKNNSLDSFVIFEK